MWVFRRGSGIIVQALRMKSPMTGPFRQLSTRARATLASYRTTLLCGLVTLLVLRGTASGRGATARAQRLEHQLPRRELALEKEAERVREVAEEKATEWDPAVPFQLGPRIANWDEQRAEWLRRHPGANATAGGKPRVLLLTGSQPRPCESTEGSFQLLKALKNKMDYCRLHGVEIYYNLAHLDAAMNSFWVKLPLLRKMMLTRPDVEWFWWMDSDALFTDMEFELPMERFDGYNMVINGGDEGVYRRKSWLGLNAGVFLVRNCQWTLDLMDAWALMGPKGKVREEYGKLFATALSDRPAYESDDQSALVYLLNADRERWGSKVMLETSVGLHGYWVMLVDQYEELMLEGNGSRKPFVTHFVGCKPCGKGGEGSYAIDRCLLHMDRAFNFADNQVLALYGFRHDSLTADAVHRVQSESSDPLQLQLHPKPKPKP